MTEHPGVAPDIVVVSAADPDDTDSRRVVDMAPVEDYDRRPALGRRLAGYLDATGAHLVVHWAGGISIHDVAATPDALEPPAIVVVPEEVRDVAVSPDDVVAVADHRGSVQLYALKDDPDTNVRAGDEIGRPYSVRPGTNGVLVGFLPDGTLLTGGQVITFWKTDGSSVLGESAAPGGYGAEFSPDGSVMATSDRFGGLRLTRVSTGDLVTEVSIPRNGLGVPATPMVFTEDGAALVVVGGRGSQNPSGAWPFTFGIGHIEVFDTSTGELITDPVVLENGPEPTAVALSPDQTELAVGYRTGRVELRSFPGLELTEIIQSFHATEWFAGDNRISGLAFTEDGTNLVALNDQGAMASRSIAAHEREWELDASGDLQGFELLDGGLVTSSLDGTLTISDLDDPTTPRVELIGHAGEVRSMAAVGNLLAGGSEVEGRVRLWDLETPEPFGRPIPAADPVVDISSDGHWLAVADGGFVGIWSLDPDDWAEAACDVAGRNLTQAEWDRYLPTGEPYHVTCPQWPTAV
jgi:WD40 repeat protein